MFHLDGKVGGRGSEGLGLDQMPDLVEGVSLPQKHRGQGVAGQKQERQGSTVVFAKFHV